MHDLLRNLWQRPIIYGSLISTLTFAPISIDCVIAQETQQEAQIPHDHSEEFYVKTYGSDIVALKAELKQHPTSKGYVKLSDAYLEHKQFKNGANAAKQAIKIDPNNWEGYHNLGTMQTELGELDGAWMNFQKANKLAPDNPYPYVGFAGVYEEHGDYSSAVRLMEKAVRLDSNNPEFLRRLGIYQSRVR